MNRSRMSLLTISVLAMSWIFTSTASLAAPAKYSNPHKTHQSYKSEKHYKGEAMPKCHALTLLDGLYFGAAAGYDSYRMVDEVTDNGFLVESVGSFRSKTRLSVNGAVGGAFVGLGHYFGSFYNTYLGVELFGNGSAASSNYEKITNVGPASDGYHTVAKVQSNYGVSLLPGIKLNPATLLYVRLGYNWSNIQVDENIFTQGIEVLNVDESVTANGFNYGIGVEGAFLGQWSVRAEYTHTDYNSFDTSLDTHISPSSNQFMMGLIFHFT